MLKLPLLLNLALGLGLMLAFQNCSPVNFDQTKSNGLTKASDGSIQPATGGDNSHDDATPTIQPATPPTTPEGMAKICSEAALRSLDAKNIEELKKLHGFVMSNAVDVPISADTEFIYRDLMIFDGKCVSEPSAPSCEVAFQLCQMSGNLVKQGDSAIFTGYVIAIDARASASSTQFKADISIKVDHVNDKTVASLIDLRLSQGGNVSTPVVSPR
jgi:hypothetical protein